MMEKQIRLLSGIYALLFSLFLMNTVVNATEPARALKSPLSKGLSVFRDGGSPSQKDYIIYGFLPYWKMDKAEYLQLDKLTDIAYFALRINKDGSIATLDDEGNIDPGYNHWRNNQDFNDLIERAKSTDTRIALTILSHDPDVSDYFLHCEECWPTMADALVEELTYKGLKDLNFDFEYNDINDDATANQYTKLIDFVNKRLDAEFGSSFVTVSTFADSVVKPRLTKVGDLAKISDGIFIMAYDFHRPSSDNAGPVAPINGAGIYSEYDIKTMVDDYMSQVPPSKLILGVPYYGYNWVVGEKTPYAERIPGDDNIGYSVSQAYEQVIDTILEVKPKIMWDDLAKTPYFSYTSPGSGSSRIVYFENPQSLQYKYRLAKDNGFKGVGIWALGYDGGYQELWELLDTEFSL